MGIKEDDDGCGELYGGMDTIWNDGVLLGNENRIIS